MERALILISPDFTRPGTVERERVQLQLAYQEMVFEAGGNPIIASAYMEPVEAAGWLITGGDDFPGEMLGEETHPESRPAHPLRFEMELRLLEFFAPRPTPILGICFGSQFLAFALGGRLIQHLPDVVCHVGHKEGRTRIVSDSEKIWQGEFEALCFHHQAIAEPPSGWRVCARAEDGTIEAIEDQSHPWRVGVQWHPERTADSPQTLALFRNFVEATRR